MTSDVSYPASGHRILAELEEKSFWFNHRNHIIVSAFQRFPPPGSVLDVGGGNGYVSLALKRAGFETTVVEPGPDGAGTARERGLDVIEASIQEISIEPESIAAIGAFDVIEHIEDDRSALGGFHDALAPGGRVYLAVPAYSWLWSHDDEVAGHYRRYTVSRLRNRVEEVGFTPLYATYFFACLVAPLFALRTAPSAMGLRRDLTPEQAAAEHAPLRGLTRGVVDPLLALERRIIANGGRVPFGTSMLLIAEKK
jgi:SAM-dependent methyltransferase